jgi:dTMP kinase
MRFAVIEGLDGSGKSTQIKLFRKYLEENNIKHKYLHFPRPDSSFYGELVSKFLRGELGDIKQVNPYLVALIFAGDRNDAKEMINSWIKDGYFVLLDRYVNSNIAFQCAKLDNYEKREALKNWIFKLEFEYNKLPVPDISIFLDVPFSFIHANLSRERKGADRSYLNGAVDIHEEDIEFQKEVKKIYLSLKGTPSYEILDCSDTTGKVLQPNQIFNKIVKTIFVNEKH